MNNSISNKNVSQNIMLNSNMEQKTKSQNNRM